MSAIKKKKSKWCANWTLVIVSSYCLLVQLTFTFRLYSQVCKFVSVQIFIIIFGVYHIRPPLNLRDQKQLDNCKTEGRMPRLQTKWRYLQHSIIREEIHHLVMSVFSRLQAFIDLQGFTTRCWKWQFNLLLSPITFGSLKSG